MGRNPREAGTTELSVSLTSSETQARVTSYDAFAGALRRELAPRGVLERVLADRVILSAWTLQEAAEREQTAILDPRSREGCDEWSGCEPGPRGIFLVSSCLGRSLEQLFRLREGALPRRGRPTSRTAPSLASTEAFEDVDPAPDPDEDRTDFSNEWTVIPRGRQVPSEPEENPEVSTGDQVGALHERWEDRLVIDLNVSERSPVVKGTWVTVSHVVSLIVDGWSWSDILRTHPELTEDDIRTCLAYTVAEDEAHL